MSPTEVLHPPEPIAVGALRPVAACADGGGGLTALFFSDELPDIAAAKRVCAECPLMAECLEGALDRRERWGVWGGQLFDDGRVVVSKRPRGRPRKHPRPEDQLLHIPFPASLAHREPCREPQPA